MSQGQSSAPASPPTDEAQDTSVFPAIGDDNGPLDTPTGALPQVAAGLDSPTMSLPVAASSSANAAGANSPRVAVPSAGGSSTSSRRTRRHVLVNAVVITALLLVTAAIAAVRLSPSPEAEASAASTGAATTPAPAESSSATPSAAATATATETPSPSPEPETTGPDQEPDPDPTERTTPPGPAPTTAPAPPPPAPEPTRSEPPPQDTAWSTTVDNSSRRFTASDNWAQSTGSTQQHGSDFHHASPYVQASDAAWYRVDIPKTGQYQVDVWYPADPGHNDNTPYVVVTSTGNQVIHVDQRSNGGRWVKLGTFTLAAGDQNVVAVSRWTSGTGSVIADAVRITEV